MDVHSAVFKQFQDIVFSNLREDYPYMSIDAVHDAAEQTAKAGVDTMMSKVNQQIVQIEESKARSSFMSLPPELRERIYELSVLPETDGEGGVPGCRAIAINHSPSFRGLSLPTSWCYHPAITKTSSRVRAESLAVYYGKNNFVIYCAGVLRPAKPGNSPLNRLHGLEEESMVLDFDLQKQAQIWLQLVGSENLSSIKHLDVCFSISPVRGPTLLKMAKALKRGEMFRATFCRDWPKYATKIGVDVPAGTTYLVELRASRSPDGYIEKYWIPMSVLDTL